MSFRKLHIDDLPDETLQEVFTFLPHLKERKPLALVCRRWDRLAFDYRYLGRIVLDVMVWSPKQGDFDNNNKISRNYRKIRVMCLSSTRFDEEQTEKLLTWFEKPSLSLEEFECVQLSPDFLTLKLLSECLRVKKAELDFCAIVPDDRLPVLAKLEGLVIKDPSKDHVIHPDTKQRMFACRANILHNLPMAIPELPLLEHLRVEVASPSTGLFQYCSKPTKITSLDLPAGQIDQTHLEQLCKFCPSLIKLRIAVSSTVTSLQCLASLTHLKVLSLDVPYYGACLFNDQVCLSSAEIFEFKPEGKVLFNNRKFPNVHHLKVRYYRYSGGTVRIRDSFPHLRTLDLLGTKKSIFELLEGLSNLRELIVHDLDLSDSHLPPLNSLQQLTLKNATKLEVTDAMATNLPNLRFLNLFNTSRCTNPEKLPATCTVRRYLRDCRKDIFDVV